MKFTQSLQTSAVFSVPLFASLVCAKLHDSSLEKDTTFNEELGLALFGRQIIAQAPFPTQCGELCAAVIRSIPCGRVNACTCTTAVLNDLQPCQECLTQEQQFEEQESIINDTGDFPVSTEVPNFPSLMTPGEFMEACSGAGFPIEDGSSSSATPAENSPSESSPSSISNPSTEPNGKLASNQSQISGGNVNISDQTWLFLSLCFLGIIMVS